MQVYLVVYSLIEMCRDTFSEHAIISDSFTVNKMYRDTFFRHARQVKHITHNHQQEYTHGSSFNILKN